METSFRDQTPCEKCHGTGEIQTWEGSIDCDIVCCLRAMPGVQAYSLEAAEEIENLRGEIETLMVEFNRLRQAAGENPF